jgi:3-hydroxyisobutyrate dehydrogenase
VHSKTGKVSPVGDKKIGFVGLGVMGAPMARHVLDANGSIWVYNRTVSKAQELIDAGAIFAQIEDLADHCDVILVCVTRSEDVKECLDRLMHAKPGTLVVDHSTIAPRDAKAFHEELSLKKLRFVDAPITGGSVGALAGKLTIFMGGEEADVAEAKEIAKPYTKRAERVGGPGAGQMAKMVNQIAVAGTLLSLCESLAFAEKAGLDLPLIQEMVGSGAGGSWCFDVYGKKILNRDWTPGFTITNQIKDLIYCQQAAEEIGAKLPATALTHQLLGKLQNAGQGNLTTAALFNEYLEPDD